MINEFMKKEINMLHQEFYPCPRPPLEPTRETAFFNRFLDCDFDFTPAHHLMEFECILVLGTGGSSLGGQTLECITQGSVERELIFLDNIDPETFDYVLQTFDPETTGVLAISKSGETPETLSQVLTLSSLWEKEQLAHHFCIITQETPSTLFHFAKNNNIPLLSHPQNIGGRYSIFTNVGMLIAHFLGLSPQKIHQGARAYLKHNYQNNLVGDATGFLTEHFLAKKTQMVMMPYSDRLTLFSAWFAQLWGESVGKQGKGLTPISAKGTVDQHSQLQLYLDGPRDKIFTFISLPRPKGGQIIDHPDAPEFLKGKTMGDLFFAQEKATIETLAKKRLPVRVMEIPNLEEETIGALFMHFIMETVNIADLLKVDPFNQPAVEEGKILAKTYLLEGKFP
jgi:glucose-6-phosphate isomerase